MPNILELSPYFFPEQISSTHLAEDLNEALYAEGFCIENYVPTPTRGVSDEVREQYKKLKEEVRDDGHMTVHRFSMFREGKNPVGRALRYVLVNLIQSYKGANAEDINVVYSGSTPPTQGLLCGRVARRLSRKYKRKVPFVYNLQDVFPDSLVSAGLTSKGSILWKIGRKMEDRTYRYADRIIVISEDIRKNILEKGVPEEKIEVIPNWIDTQQVHPVRREENPLFDEIGVDRSKFIVVYAGNLGMAQGIDTLIEAVKRIDDVEFLIFGGGSSREDYVKKSEGCTNVHWLALMPQSRVSEVYSIGDLCLVACKPGLGSGAVPSKTFSIMATGTPILLSFDEGTELWNLVKGNDCGFCTHAGNVEELSAAIRYAKDHPDELAKMGKNARACVEKTYSKQIGTSRTIEVIRKAVEKAKVFCK